METRSDSAAAGCETAHGLTEGENSVVEEEEDGLEERERARILQRLLCDAMNCKCAAYALRCALAIHPSLLMASHSSSNFQGYLVSVQGLVTGLMQQFALHKWMQSIYKHNIHQTSPNFEVYHLAMIVRDALRWYRPPRLQ